MLSTVFAVIAVIFAVLGPWAGALIIAAVCGVVAYVTRGHAI